MYDKSVIRNTCRGQIPKINISNSLRLYKMSKSFYDLHGICQV